MKLRRTSLAFITATAVTLSALSPVAEAQEGTSQESTTVTTQGGEATQNSPVPAEQDPNQWPGSVEGSSMLSSGEIPIAPSFGSSGKKNSEEDGDESGGLVDDNGDIPVIGSISLPGWVAVPIGIIQAVMTVSTFALQAAYMVLSINPEGSQILREWLISVGVNPDA